MACAGDITDQGFHKKKAKIEAKYCQKLLKWQKSWLNHPHPFRKQYNHCMVETKDLIHQQYVARKKENQEITENVVSLTVVCLHSNVYAVPKRKMSCFTIPASVIFREFSTFNITRGGNIHVVKWG